MRDNEAGHAALFPVQMLVQILVQMLLLAPVLAVSARTAMAQAPVVAQPPAATVVITAPRPLPHEAYREAEARIRKRLANRIPLNSAFLSGCMENRFAAENSPVRASRLPSSSDRALAARTRCARVHIEARDTTLKRGLEAFDRHDYATARALFQEAWWKMGVHDAALMLAKMHVDGLGAPKDPAGAVKWLREIVDDKFDPEHETLRFDPGRPALTNARIDAAMMLATLYDHGDGVAYDREQAVHWLAKAVEFGFVPARGYLDHGMPLHDTGAGASPATVLAPTEAQPAPLAPPPLLESVAVDAAAPALAAPRAPPQSEVDGHAFMVVRVSGLRAVPWKSYRALRAALAAYAEHRALAPDADFAFAVMAPPGMAALPPNFQLRVRTRDGREFPIALEDGELFQLPALPDPGVDADLVSNLKDGPLRIGLLVRTRAVPQDQERLGDIRLRNEISQAIAAVDTPAGDYRCWRKRRANDCKPGHVTVWFKPRAPSSGAWLVEGARREALQTNGNAGDPSYRIPVDAGHLGNDALIEFNYRNPLGPPQHASVAVYVNAD